MSCELCYQEPCACQRQLAVANHWLVQACSTPHCGVMIRMRNGKHEAKPICKWCVDDPATKLAVVVEMTQHPKAPGFASIRNIISQSIPEIHDL